MKKGKRAFDRPALLALALAVLLPLSGCSVLGFLMTPDWVEDADLIVVNQNETPVYAVTVTAEDWGETAYDARGYALLERGESYGLYLEETGPVTVTLSGEDGEELASCSAEFRGQRLVLTYTQGGRVSVQVEKASGETASETGSGDPFSRNVVISLKIEKH